MADAPLLVRVAFKTSRSLDFIGERELTAQIGHQANLWPLVCLKECHRVEVSTDPGAAGITIADNGPGIPAETISDILDFSSRTSSREAYCSPTRGAQGNALKTIIAMPLALSGGTCGETVIESRGIVHRISFRADAVRQEPRIERHQEPAVVKNGTSITVLWPDSACPYLEGNKDTFLQIAVGYAALNPHLSLKVYWDGEKFIDLPATDESWHPFRACDPTSAYWYDVPRLARYAAAHVARDQDRGQIRTVRDFIAEFRGLRGSAKQKLVLEQSGLIRQPLAALFDGGTVNNGRVRDLLEAMCRHTRPVKPRDLGIIGEAHMSELCEAASADKMTFRYRTISGETIDQIPFVVEAAFAAAPDSDQVRRLVLGVNFAAALGNPFRTFDGYYQGLETRLADQRCGAKEPVVVILHLAQARVEYQDRGKSAVVLNRAISGAITTALESVTGKWAKQRKAEERDHSRRMRRRDQLIDKPARVSIKDAAWKVMCAAYLKASDNGQLPAKPRQIMYAARPVILEVTGKETLDDRYFTQTLLPDYIEEHADECASWDIVWDARGTFSEPHTGKEVPLGTLEVREYLGLRATGAPPITISTSADYDTHGPEHRFDTVLFVEKEGFAPLFNAVRLAERYDLAIMSTKGMSVTASRMLLDQLSNRGLKRILVLHDFDVSGFSISGTLATSSRRYRFTNNVPLINLGLRLDQVEEMDLESEPVSVRDDWEKRVTTLKRHGATAAEIDFLRERRVEINAMTSRQLVDFIEERLALHKVTKVIPPQEVLADHARHLIEQKLARTAFDELRAKFTDEARQAVLPEDLCAEVQAEIDGNPQAPWDRALAAVVARLARG
jgi:hypothetical protein